MKIPYPAKGDHPIKMLVDRLYSFLKFKENPQTGQPTIDSSFPPGKRPVFLISRGDPEPPAFFPQFYNHLNGWLNLIPLSLGVQKYDFFYQYGADIDRLAARNDHTLLEKARAAGAGLL